jgi:hypothetical protein
LTNKNQQLQEEKSQLIRSLEHQDALLRTRGNADSPVRQIRLPTMPDTHTTYDTKAVPPAVRLPTDEHHRLTPLARQYILAVLLFPDASNSFNEARQAWLKAEWASIVSELIEDAAASPLRHHPINIDLSLIAEALRCLSPSIRAEAQGAFQRGFIAGAVLYTLVQMKKSGMRMSIRRACNLIADTFGRRAAADQFPLVTRTRPESLRRDWEAFRDVAHLWAAVVLSATTPESEPRFNDLTAEWARHNPLGNFHTIWTWRHYQMEGNSFVHIWGSHTNFARSLACAEAFRRFGTEHKLHAQQEPMINPKTTWTIAASADSSISLPESDIPPIMTIVPSLINI